MSTTYVLNDVDIESVAALAEAITADPSQASTEWKAEVTWRGGFRSEAVSRDFPPVPSDEPAGLGGTDTAPNPVEQLLGAFGNCLAVGVAANASARSIAINDLKISLSGHLDLNTFLGLADGHAGFSAVSAAIHLETDAAAEDVEALIHHVVSTSPVGHTLSASIPVDVRHTTEGETTNA